MEKENTGLQQQSSGAVASVSTLSIENYRQTMAVAKELAEFVTEMKLSSPIQGKQYVQVEGWQFAGAMLGLFAVSEGTECLNYAVTMADGSKKPIFRYKAKVSIYNKDGRKVGGATGLCSGAEPNKKGYEEYAIESMSQTRATSKAFRIMLGWMMKAAGYESTPFEEMEGVNGGGALELVSDELHARLATLMDEVGRLDLLPDAERKQLHLFLKNYKETPKDDMPARDAKKLEKILLEWKEKYKELDF